MSSLYIGMSTYEVWYDVLNNAHSWTRVEIDFQKNIFKGSGIVYFY